MKKIIILLFTTLLVTGCEATYSVEYNNKEFSELTQIYDQTNKTKEAITNDTTQKQIIDTLYDFESKNPEIANRKFFANDSVAGYEYKHSFKNSKDLNGWPSLAGQCYQYFDIYEKDSALIIKTPAQFLCFDNFKELTKVTIQFKTDYKVITHNADTVDENTYIWTVLKESPVKPIYIEIDHNYDNKEVLQKEKKTFLFTLVLSLGGILAIGILLYFIFKNKKKIDSF